METLESSRVCRLCGKQSGISINIFDKNQNHVKMINTVLPIMVHEMDLLPKHMCHRCSYKLETFHKFYLDCLKIDADLKGQLSWMRKEESRERVGVPMVHIENVKIKEEPHDYNTYDDTNPIVDNVDNVDYMNSVTFPVDGIESKGITYATYTRCGCYCDKTGQSFDNRLSRCNGRLGDVTSTDDTVANGPHSTKTNFLENKIPQDRSNLLTYTSEYSNNYRQYSTNSRRFAAKENVQETNFIRNLRPRRTAVDYVQTGRRATGISLPKNRNKLESSEDIPQTNFGVTQIKVEKLDDIVGRILRPRKRTIAYMYPKRKYSRKSEKNRSLPIDDRPPSKAKVRNIASQLKLKSMSTEKLKVDIKEEPVSDVEDFFNIVSTTPFDRMLKKNDSIGNLTDRTNLLRDGRVEFNDRTIGNSVHINRNQRDNNFGRNEIWDRAHSLSKSSSKSMETGLHRFIAANRSLGYLRSPDLCLRNGKIRRYNVPSASLKTIGRDLTERTRATIDVKNLSSSPMLFDDIKYYCDECNTKFASKELYKLHACYGHR